MAIARRRAARVVSTYAQAGAQVVVETLWPTRCVICDRPGELLCPACRLQLPFIDQWSACPVCGAPFGWLECTECNPVSLRASSRTAVPFERCVSALAFDDAVARIVRTHKDAGERRLGRLMAFAIACAIPPEWLAGDCAVSYIPATAAAISRRGFDHGRAIAGHVADMVGAACIDTLERPRSHDQRGLSRDDRFANMRGRFKAVDDAMPSRVILIDDVYTTGATLYAASDALREVGVAHVMCATFARVY